MSENPNCPSFWDAWPHLWVFGARSPSNTASLPGDGVLEQQFVFSAHKIVILLAFFGLDSFVAKKN
jgi:hypothetical protein